VVLERLDLAPFVRDQMRLRPGLIQRLARLSHLDLLEAVGDEDRDLQSVEVTRSHVRVSVRD